MAPKKKSKKTSKTLAKASMKKTKGGVIAIMPANNTNLTSKNFNTTSLNNASLGNNLTQP